MSYTYAVISTMFTVGPTQWTVYAKIIFKILSDDFVIMGEINSLYVPVHNDPMRYAMLYFITII